MISQQRMSSFVVEVENPDSSSYINLGVYKARYGYRAAQKSYRKGTTLCQCEKIKVRLTDEKSRQSFQELSSKSPSEQQKRFGLTRKVVSKKIVETES